MKRMIIEFDEMHDDLATITAVGSGKYYNGAYNATVVTSKAFKVEDGKRLVFKEDGSSEEIMDGANNMGQALEICVHCENKRGCDNCGDLHNWIMEHLDAEPKWISVKDEVPELGKRVLICDIRGGINIGRRHFAETDNIATIEKSNTCRGFTHWMPLPEAPKE